MHAWRKRRIGVLGAGSLGPHGHVVLDAVGARHCGVRDGPATDQRLHCVSRVVARNHESSPVLRLHEIGPRVKWTNRGKQGEIPVGRARQLEASLSLDKFRSIKRQHCQDPWVKSKVATIQEGRVPERR